MTAVRYNLPVIWIIFHDGEYKLIKLYQIEAFHETGLVDFDNPDYVAYAKACGAQGFRVNSLSEFETAFRTALASGKPTLSMPPSPGLPFRITAPTPPGSWRPSKKFWKKAGGRLRPRSDVRPGPSPPERQS